MSLKFANNLFFSTKIDMWQYSTIAIAGVCMISYHIEPRYDEIRLSQRML